MFFLVHCYVAFGDSVHALCLIAVCSAVSPRQLFKILSVINLIDFCIPSYRNAEAVGNSTDA